MKEQKLVSVIIPAYKTEAYIERCLKSLQAQTYSNLEIIVIDDKSPDKTGEICDNIAEQDPRIIVIHHEVNKGVSSARNSGLQICTGEYIAFVDGDDFISSTLVEECVTCIEKELSDVVIFNSSVVKNNQIINEHMDKKYFVDYYTVYKAIIEDKIPNYLWNKFFKAFCWEGITLPENTDFEDLMIMPKVFEGINKVSYLDKPLYFYNCDNESSITSNISSKSKYGLFCSFLYRQPLAKKMGMNDFVDYCRLRAIRSAVSGIGLNLVRDELNQSQVNHMLDYLRKEKNKVDMPKIGLKYKILLYGALRNQLISRIYGISMYTLERIKKMVLYKNI